METFLPSRRFVTGVAVIIAIISFFFLLRNVTFTTEDEVGGTRTLLATSSPEVRGAFEDTDTDGDGLYDWEEKLWGSDITVSDTDGDGTSDYDEVEQGRHPLWPAPGDEIEDDYLDTFAVSTETSNLNTLTEKLLTEYFRLREDGELTSDDKTELLENILSSDITIPEVPTYGREDISVSNDTTASIRVYGNELGSLLQIHAQEMSQYDFAGSLQKAIATNNPESFKNLEGGIVLLESLIQNMLSTPVPPSAERLHVEFINATSLVATTLRYLQNIEEAPIEGYILLQQLQGTLDSLQTLQSDFQSYFQNKGVTYNETEGGYFIISS